MALPSLPDLAITSPHKLPGGPYSDPEATPERQSLLLAPSCKAALISFQGSEFLCLQGDYVRPCLNMKTIFFFKLKGPRVQLSGRALA